MKKLLSICVLLLILLAGVSLAEEAWMNRWNEIVPLNCDPAKYLVKLDYRWSMVDENGEMIEEDMLDQLGEFIDGVAVVRKLAYYGYLKDDGQFLIHPVFAQAGNFYNGLARVEAGEKKGFVNRQGEFAVNPVYDYANDFCGGYATVGLKGAKLERDDSSSDDDYEQLWGMIDIAGNIVVPLEYDSVSYDLEIGTALAMKGERAKEYVLEPVKPDGEAAGNANWKIQWDEIIDLKCEPVKYLARWNYKWSLLDENGRVLREDMLDQFNGFDGGVSIVRKGTGYGFLRDDGSFLIEPVLEHVAPFWDGLAQVEKDGKCGFINLDGEIAVDFIYDYANSFVEGYAQVGVKGASLADDDSGSSGDNYEILWGLIDTAGNVIIPLEYDSIGLEDGAYVAREDDQEYIYEIINGQLQEIVQVRSGLNMADYMPNSGEKVAVLDDEADIQWDSSAPLPTLDGATALFPVYSAFAQATYPEVLRYGEEKVNPVITCTKTNRAYERLIEGAVDVIFCAQPSDAQLEMAQNAGVEFELTPFGKEAFVFIVNKTNPLEGITVEQIQKVYSGQITQWSDLGVDGIGEIVAYQRPKNSGSQTALEALMGDIPLMAAPGTVEDFMGDMLDAVEYRNTSDALGYTFRFYCVDMEGSDVKLLSIDGVAPTVENIRSDAYPITSTLYAVTLKGEDNPNVQILLDWMRSAQGRELIEKSGYVAW